jgi:hypothetical protein
MLKDPEPLLVWCTRCEAGLSALPGPLPEVCPKCEQPAFWSTTAPYRLTRDDKSFLRVNKIRP